jgi:MFS family permease
MIVFALPSARVQRGKKASFLSGFNVVLRSKASMAYVLAYAAHMWELFSLRSWIVAFLTFSISLQSAGSPIWSATQVAFVINLIGLPASFGGNELSRKFGRKRVITIVMLFSAATAVILGFSAALPYLVVAIIAIVYGMTIVGDSASLTAGVVAAAPEGYRGTTLAVHSTIGFGSAFLGPLAVGIVLDLFGGGRTAWGMAFICMAAGCLLGPVILRILGSKESAACDR